MKSPLRKSLLYLSAVLLLIYVAVCIFFFQIQEPSIFPARQIPQEVELGFALEHEELFVDAPDGARLNGVLFKVENPQGVVLHFHGNGENILDMQSVAEPFIRERYDFLAMDYRTYGKSTGELSEASLFDDALLFMQLLESRGWEQADVFIHGRSIGTGIAIHLASVTQPRALLLHSPYYSMHSLVVERFPFLPVGLILQYPLNSAQYLPSVDCPVLILHGEVDEVIPLSHAEQLAAIKGELVTFPTGGHNNLPRFPQFWEEIAAFLNDTE